jgi:hypothetical protein
VIEPRQDVRRRYFRRRRSYSQPRFALLRGAAALGDE